MRIQWTRSAIGDLAEIRIAIERDKPDAAAGVARRILDVVYLIETYPDVGKSGRASGTQELVVAATPYIIIYRRFKGRIQLLRVLHARRRWPPRQRHKR